MSMAQAVPVFNTAEQRMWNFITDGGLTLNAKDMFEIDKWKSTARNNMWSLIKSNFKVDLRDDNGKLHKDCGISPHILRHMRAYNVIVNYGVEVPYAVAFFGWKDERMLYYYAHIRDSMNIKSQVDMLRRGNFLTELKVDLGKAVVQSY
jgi:integrase